MKRIMVSLGFFSLLLSMSESLLANNIVMKPAEILAIHVANNQTDNTLYRYALITSGGWEFQPGHEAAAEVCRLNGGSPPSVFKPGYAIFDNDAGSKEMFAAALAAKAQGKEVVLKGTCDYHWHYFRVKSILIL